jgi:hypothetical protein
MTPWQGLWTLHANVDMILALSAKENPNLFASFYVAGLLKSPHIGQRPSSDRKFSQQDRYFYTLRAYKPLSTTGNVHPHPLTSSLLAAEFALLVLRVYISARRKIGVPAVRFAGEMNYRRLSLPYLC